MISIADAHIISQKVGLSPRTVIRWARDLDLNRAQINGYLQKYDIDKLRIMIDHHEPTMAQLPDVGQDHTNNLLKRILGGK